MHGESSNVGYMTFLEKPSRGNAGSLLLLSLFLFLKFNRSNIDKFQCRTLTPAHHIPILSAHPPSISHLPLLLFNDAYFWKKGNPTLPSVVFCPAYQGVSPSTLEHSQQKRMFQSWHIDVFLASPNHIRHRLNCGLSSLSRIGRSVPWPLPSKCATPPFLPTAILCTTNVHLPSSVSSSSSSAMNDDACCCRLSLSFPRWGIFGRALGRPFR